MIPNENIPQWSLHSWTKKTISQQPSYKDIDELNKVLSIITNNKGITSSLNINYLKKHLIQAENNKAFIIIAGDCCEPFEEADKDIIKLKCAFLEYLSTILMKRLNKNIIPIGRIAGQYAKPRSNNTELIDGVEYLSFRGEIINSFNKSNREPDADRLLEGYKISFEIRKEINEWNNKMQNFMEILDISKSNWRKSDIINIISDCDQLCSLSENSSLSKNEVSSIFTCHEGLLLNYESSLTRKESNKYYNLSSDLLWIGERTNKLEEAHIEFFRGISNPVSIKFHAIQYFLILSKQYQS